MCVLYSGKNIYRTLIACEGLHYIPKVARSGECSETHREDVADKAAFGLTEYDGARLFVRRQQTT